MDNLFSSSGNNFDAFPHYYFKKSLLGMKERRSAFGLKFIVKVSE